MNQISILQNFYIHLKQFILYYVIAFIAIEAIVLMIKLHKIYYKEVLVNIVTGIVAIATGVLLKTYYFNNLYPLVYAHRIFNLELNAYTWVLAFFMYTFIQYGTHFIYHKVRIFWCLHEVHHSATQMNSTTGLRSSIFDIVSLDILYLAIPFLGIDPIVYFIIYSLNKIWGTFIHINENLVSRIPFLDKILVTPEIHHIHHASNICYLDKNYGEVVPWFDQIFKTYAKLTTLPIYGTLKVQQEIGFWQSQLHEFKLLITDIKFANNWIDKIKYMFMPPGWQPNNFTQTVKYLQKQY